MMKKALLLFITLIVILTASGCSNYIHPAVSLPIINSTYTSSEVAIAVDISGVKHIARLECPTIGSYPCQLIYTRVRPGLANHSETAGFFQPTPPNSISDIDIAVTDSGVAFIVFRYNYHLHYFVSSISFTNPLSLDPTYLLADNKPLAIARGNSLYVVYTVKDVTDHTQIRYQRLSPDATVGGWVDNTASQYLYHVDAAVGWNGKLYVAYAVGSIIKYADNHLDTGDMTTKITVDSYHNWSPRIDVNGLSETVFYIYSIYNGSGSDYLYIGHCPANNCTSGTFMIEPVPLDGPSNYKLTEDPRVLAVFYDLVTPTINAWYAFPATWAGSSSADVYLGNIQVASPSSSFSSLYQLSNTTEEEVSVRLCLTFSFNPVVVWRVYTSPPYFGKMKEFGYYSGLSSVSDTSYGTHNFDLSCNADWGGGIWNQYTVTPGVDQAWVSFNTYPALVPLVTK